VEPLERNLCAPATAGVQPAQIAAEDGMLLSLFLQFFSLALWLLEETNKYKSVVL